MQRLLASVAIPLTLIVLLVSYRSVAPTAEIQAAEPASTATAANAKLEADFKSKMVPFLDKYCNTCHSTENNSGGVSLDVYESAAHAKKDRKTWESIDRVIEEQEMPPKHKKQPTKDERIEAVTFLKSSLLNITCVGPKDPGRVTIRRLNRSEYNKTVRDLLGVNDFQPANDFPSDDVGYGFDNIGDVLSVQPILIEKYLAAADKVLNKALTKPSEIKQTKQAFRSMTMIVIPRGAKDRTTQKVNFTVEGAASIEQFNFPVDGEYSFNIRAWGTKLADEKPQLILRIDGKDVKTFDVEATADKPTILTVKTTVKAGEKRVSMAFANPKEDKSTKSFRILGLDQLEIDGPVKGTFQQPGSNSIEMVLVAEPNTDGTKDKLDSARKVIGTFARRAFRRPVSTAEVDRLVKLYQLADSKGDDFTTAIKLPLKAILVSPHFLFRVEPDPKAPLESRTLNEHELATRLSYFLWSSTPDEELLTLADKGGLRKPGVLKAQVTRMLKDWKSQSLTSDFSGQWLMTRSVWGASPDMTQFPSFTENLKAAMVTETEMYFDSIVKNDSKVTDFLDSDYTFVNETLAKHYGLKDVSGPEFRKVKLADTRRGGILTQASILTVTSNPTRTSPVKRGKWVLDNILASPPPPAPPNIPELEKTALKGTLRQQMEQHRVNPTCAGCHAKMDPIGFGLENFDAIGAWREKDKDNTIDASGVLPGQLKFNGPAELRKILLGKSDQFRKCLAEKLLTFALGRGLEHYDKCILDELVLKLKAGEDRFSALVLAIVESEPFQQRKAKRSE